jgi:hypothetical protein
MACGPFIGETSPNLGPYSVHHFLNLYVIETLVLNLVESVRPAGLLNIWGAQ